MEQILNEEVRKLPRYRTIKGCLELLKTIDESTAITEWYIRHLCKTNQIKYLPSGNKSLVNYDDLLLFLKNQNIGA